MTMEVKAIMIISVIIKQKYNNTLLEKIRKIFTWNLKKDGIPNNTKWKKQKKIRHWKKISKNGNIKSSDTNTDVSNQIFIMGDSIENYV